MDRHEVPPSNPGSQAMSTRVEPPAYNQELDHRPSLTPSQVHDEALRLEYFGTNFLNAWGSDAHAERAKLLGAETRHLHDFKYSSVLEVFKQIQQDSATAWANKDVATPQVPVVSLSIRPADAEIWFEKPGDRWSVGQDFSDDQLPPNNISGRRE